MVTSLVVDVLETVRKSHTKCMYWKTEEEVVAIDLPAVWRGKGFLLLQIGEQEMDTDWLKLFAVSYWATGSHIL